MSYSFSVQAQTKDAVAISIMGELLKVVAAQPVHSVDRVQVYDAARSLVDLLPDDPERDIYASVSGGISKADDGIQWVSLSVSVGLAVKKPVGGVVDAA